jgi:cephalosporin hydroxylase
MLPFWEMVVAPIVKASRGRRVLEIGALRGETTAQMFEQLGPESELHVIDPLPQFDPAEHEAAFPGRYVFHRALSLEVLPTLPPVGVALIDGDHNWYTVYNELKLLAGTAVKAKRPLPVMILHDVDWPYGHRDLYYEPSQIPEEFRQPYARKGLAPGFFRVLDVGGMNADLCNAIDGGGPRNGVRCALDDFLAERDEELRLVHLPFYFGLAIVVDARTLAARPELAALLDRIESPQGQRRMLALSERIRIDGEVHNHNVDALLHEQVRANRDRWLGVLKAALLDEHYFENEVRISYLTGLPPGATADLSKLRDPLRDDELRYKRMAQARRAGRSTDEPRQYSSFPYTDMGRAALDHLEQAAASVGERAVPGDLAECGVGRGGGGILLRACIDAYDLGDRTVWMVDTFEAGQPDFAGEATSRAAQLQADLNQVRDAFDRFDLLDARVRFLQGDYTSSLVTGPVGGLALLRIGIGANDELEAVLEHLLPKVAVGGVVIVEGTGKAAVAELLAKVRERLGSTEPATRVDWDTVTWTVATPAPPAPSGIRRFGRRRGGTSTTPQRVPLPAPVSGERLDLSVVVTFFNMRREAARTLTSLSRSYQRDIDDLRFEVLVVDNGSSPDQRLTAEEVASYGPEFRLVDPPETPPSPTVALNWAVGQTRGDAVAMVIDGAHVITPGVYAQAMRAMRAYAPAVVAVQQWYVGPGQQPDAGQIGYDQQAEDRLFSRIKWPTDGYRLFEIGHFIGDRDWFDGISESNCVIAPRSVLEQIGVFDDSFDMPGGGYTNLELFERLHSHPDVTPTSLLGEGSFHQFHGGTTTNVDDEGVRRRRIFEYRDHFGELRGRGLTGLTKPVQYVGAMATKAARRTRSRREIPAGFEPSRDPVASTGTERRLVPDELKLAAIEALWESQSWRSTTWLGRPVNRYPTDLHAYQEVINQARPEVVVVIGDDDGLAGRASYLASVQAQLGDGRVVAVTAEPVDLDDGPNLEVVVGGAGAPETVEAVRTAVAGRSALLIIGLGAPERVVAAFTAFEDLVPPGGYVVVENTVLNGRPVESGFGPGPHEAVVQILGSRTDWAPDVALERFTVTFNKGGYLRRLAPA